ncbi:hypothetical protein PFZ49_16660, partial [Microbacterium lacticum]|uniref:hypothetical protein n=1 Tax=Microbacterium lacticum TaxID=33885 RepID=UPI003A847A6B
TPLTQVSHLLGHSSYSRPTPSFSSRSRTSHLKTHSHLWLNIKVLGADGKWSNLDSRVAMKLHTVINAEGELAARTDSGLFGHSVGVRLAG